MAQNALLKRIPTGIKIERNPGVWGHYMTHTLLVNIVGLSFTVWLVTLPISRFPITFGSSVQRDFRCKPDYATGEILNFTRTKLRYIDYI